LDLLDYKGVDFFGDDKGSQEYETACLTLGGWLQNLKGRENTSG
jgi:hypothetical protein